MRRRGLVYFDGVFGVLIRPLPYLICPGNIVSGGGYSISLGDYSEEWKMHRRLVHSALQRCTAESLQAIIQQQALKLRQVLDTIL